MPTFIEVLPKETLDDGTIVIPRSPGGETGEGKYIDGYTRVEWFQNAFNEIATATIPLAQKHYNTVKGFDKYWLMCIAQWRKSGALEVYNIPADELIDDEEVLLSELEAQRNPQPAEEQQPTTEENTTEGA